MTYLFNDPAAFAGLVATAKAALPFLKATPGSRLVNMASCAGIYGSPGLAVYSATKHAVRGLTEALDAEWAPEGIKVRSLMPGFIDTPMLRAAPIDADAFAQTLPMKRIGKPEDIAAACAYLASEEASYITGQTISTNGGRYMGSH